MQIKKKSCANVQCTVDKRWMHTKKVALKDGCAQAIVALLYNVRDEKYGWTKGCASVQCSQWARWIKNAVLAHHE